MLTSSRTLRKNKKVYSYWEIVKKNYNFYNKTVVKASKTRKCKCSREIRLCLDKKKFDS